MSRSDRHKKVRVNWKRFAASVSILALLVVLFFMMLNACAKRAEAKSAQQSATQPSAVGTVLVKDDPKTPEEPEVPPEPEYPPDAELTVMCVGDIMGHLSQLYAAYDKATDSYDFHSFFTYVTSYLQSADLAIANIETSFKGAAPYTGYPSFNTPDSMADAVQDMGIDIACFSNNHMLDSGLTVLKRGVQMFRDKGFLTSGMRLDAGEKRYTLYEAQGVTFGLLNYTYETPRNNGRRTIQSGVLGDEANELINHFGSLSGVMDATVQELCAVPGVGEHTAILLTMLPQIMRRYELSRQAGNCIIQSSADAGAGATGWAFGSQTCSGNMPALAPKPTRAQTPTV